MSHEFPSIEQELATLKPQALDDDLLARLEACMEGADLELHGDELLFEEQLRLLSPAPLAAAHLAELEAITRGIPFAVDEKIVLFPGPGQAAASGKRSLWRAAAAVALIGAATAFFIPYGESSPGQTAAAPPNPPAATPQAPPTAARIAPEGISPATFNRGLAEAHDEGVVWNARNRPHRMFRIVYMERVLHTNPDGTRIEMEQPRVEYILVPEKTD